MADDPSPEELRQKQLQGLLEVRQNVEAMIVSLEADLEAVIALANDPDVSEEARDKAFNKLAEIDHNLSQAQALQVQIEDLIAENQAMSSSQQESATSGSD
ncbi:hypothetical protein [Sagittula stellata]|nr:hypothetical protein [Sagittula stellata]